MKTLMIRSIHGLSLCSLSLVALGCTESAIDADSVEEQTLTVGAASLTVPAGAAPAGFEPSILAVADAPDWAPSVIPGTLHRFGPHGTEFDKPVALTLTYDPAQLGDVKAENLRVVFLDEAGERLEMMGATVDAQAHTVTGATTHFSMFAAAPECAADADCGVGEVCIAGGCEAPIDPPEQCAADADCAAGEHCVDGACEADVPGDCADDAACAPGQACVAGACVAQMGDDTDADGWDDAEDNCPQVANPDQVDTDGDGIGDACDDAPNAEICGDGLDNDADGLIDEDCGNECDADDQCAPGQVCVDGACGAQMGVDSDADGLDDAEDNCPQVANPDQVDTDGNGIGDACDDGPAAEICGDGLDNDLDGLIDEDCGGEACEANADCGPGQACIAGICEGGEEPDGEACDGIDNNGNGLIDEGCAPGCGDDAQCGPGEQCVAGECQDNGEPEPEPEPEAEICDGLDNDADGLIDEGACGMACAADADCAPGQVCFDGMCAAQ